MVLGAVIPLLLAGIFSIVTIRLVAACRLRRLADLVVICIALAVVLTIFGIATYGSLFGPGQLLSLSSLASAAIALALTLLAGTFIVLRRRGPKWVRQLGVLYLVGGLLSPGSQAAVGIGTFGFISYCDRQNEQTVASIITTLDRYKSEHGIYPESLAAMVPQYLDKYPSSSCHELNIFERSYPDQTFVLNRCMDGEALLVVEYTYAFWHVKVYSTATRLWDDNADFVRGCDVFH